MVALTQTTKNMTNEPSPPQYTQTSDYTNQTNGGFMSPPVPDSGFTSVLNFFFNLVRYVSGFIFLGTGAYLLFFILREVYDAYHDISNNAFIGSLINWLSDNPVFYTIGEQSGYMLGRAGATIIAVVLACIIASMALGAACNFFATGMKLLQMKSS